MKEKLLTGYCLVWPLSVHRDTPGNVTGSHPSEHMLPVPNITWKRSTRVTAASSAVTILKCPIFSFLF